MTLKELLLKYEFDTVVPDLLTVDEPIKDNLYAFKEAFDTLPLHSSQQKIEEKSDDTHTVYRYRLVPTFDFKQGLLRLGPSVEVLEP